MNKLQNILKPLRIDHWIKNFVLILGYIFALFYKDFTQLNFYSLFLGLFILCISASSNYLMNEYCDRDFDKNHPVKKWRHFVKNKENFRYVLLKYISLISLSIFLSFFINFNFLILNIFFLLCGIAYNIKPLRFKEIYLIDVILESINNPVRFLMGWAIIFPEAYPPVSIILFFWFAGCFLMTMKRYSEYKFILEKKINPIKYRMSFKKYNLKNLFYLSLFYCLISFFFFTVFFIKYKIELILVIPFVCYLYIYIFIISERKNSLIMKIEKIYKDRNFVILIILITLLTVCLLNLNISFLEIFESKKLIPIK